MTKRFISLFSIALLAAFLALISLGIGAGATAFADSGISDEGSAEYSGVLNDLEKDSSFDPDLFSANANDYSISVIQVAESVNRELFVYVYQPAKTKVTAKSINISTADTGSGETLRYYNYKLRLLNSSGVFFKYKVQNLSVSSEAKRFYDISNILRGFISGVDEDPGNDNTISEVGYDVAKIYCFETINGKVTTTCLETETIEITDKFVGFVRYDGGFQLFEDGACDSHFIAFSTDRQIDDLLEADVYFTESVYTRDVETGVNNHTWESYTDPVDKYVYLEKEQMGSYTGTGVGATTFTWSRIETPEEFFADQTGIVYSGVIVKVSNGVELTTAAREEIQSKDWILRFYETSYYYTYDSDFIGYYYSSYKRFSVVDDTLILRLKFQTEGVVYDLGVVDNKQTGSADPVNTGKSSVSIEAGEGIKQLEDWIKSLPEWFESVKDVLKWVLVGISGVLVLIVLGGIISWIIKMVERSERAKVARQYRERKRK